MADYILDQAIAQFKAKIQNPKYAAYLNNPDALNLLMQDCIKEQMAQVTFEVCK